MKIIANFTRLASKKSASYVKPVMELIEACGYKPSKHPLTDESLPRCVILDTNTMQYTVYVGDKITSKLYNGVTYILPDQLGDFSNALCTDVLYTFPNIAPGYSATIHKSGALRVGCTLMRPATVKKVVDLVQRNVKFHNREIRLKADNVYQLIGFFKDQGSKLSELNLPNPSKLLEKGISCDEAHLRVNSVGRVIWNFSSGNAVGDSIHVVINRAKAEKALASLNNKVLKYKEIIINDNHVYSPNVTELIVNGTEFLPYQTSLVIDAWQQVMGAIQQDKKR